MSHHHVFYKNCVKMRSLIILTACRPLIVGMTPLRHKFQLHISLGWSSEKQ